MRFTGRLGSKDSLLGRIILGLSRRREGSHEPVHLTVFAEPKNLIELSAEPVTDLSLSASPVNSITMEASSE